jgi:hypothetical protein
MLKSVSKNCLLLINQILPEEDHKVKEMYGSFHEVEAHFATMSLVTYATFTACYFYITTESSHITLQELCKIYLNVQLESECWKKYF